MQPYIISQNSFISPTTSMTDILLAEDFEDAKTKLKQLPTFQSGTLFVTNENEHQIFFEGEFIRGVMNDHVNHLLLET